MGATPEPEPERDGLDQADPRWGVPWMADLRDVPADAVWPRLMTVPHPDAVDSLGGEFVRWAEGREGKPLRWWQRLVGARLLEVDQDGRLVWAALLLSMARQLGKSWLMRELILWRIHQGPRFGEPQTVVHTAKDLLIAKEVQGDARRWAKTLPDRFKVSEVNGQEAIRNLADGSRWMIRQKDGAYGFSSSVAAVDEAWKVRMETLTESILPTMVEREQPQLWLISTAHRLSTPLMLRRRRAALEHLESGDGDLLIEWSTPTDRPLIDVDGWRLASPHWTPQRERMVREQLESAQAGEVYPDGEESDPEESFRAQWLNQWPRRPAAAGGLDPLLPPGLWATLAEAGLESDGPVIVAVEDDYGRGAAVAVVAPLPDGRFEVDALEFPDGWDAAVGWIARLAAWRRILELHVGASMLDRLPADWSLPRARPAVSTQTAAGMAVFRDLAANGMLTHDDTPELDQALQQTLVRESPSGLQIARGPRALIKATVWAVGAAHKPARIIAVR